MGGGIEWVGVLTWGGGRGINFLISGDGQLLNWRKCSPLPIASVSNHAALSKLYECTLCKGRLLCTLWNECNVCIKCFMQYLTMYSHVSIASQLTVIECVVCNAFIVFIASIASKFMQNALVHIGVCILHLIVNSHSPAMLSHSVLSLKSLRLKPQKLGRFGGLGNAQWRKVKQLQPVQLCIFSCRLLEETFEQ